MDQLERMECKIDKVNEKVDMLLERSARTEERLNGQGQQLLGLWAVVTGAIGIFVKKIFFV